VAPITTDRPLPPACPLPIVRERHSTKQPTEEGSVAVQRLVKSNPAVNVPPRRTRP